MARENQPLLVEDLVSNINYYFKSINECANYFNVNVGSINQVINRKSNNLYKYRYRISKISIDEYIENSED